MIRVKICGLTTVDDGLAAAAAGADAIGFVFAPSSRQVTPSQARRIGQALPPFVLRVGVFVDAALDDLRSIISEAGLHVVQLHGGEDNDVIRTVQAWGLPVIKSVAVGKEHALDNVASINADGLLLDTYHPRHAGGTGQTFDWSLARHVETKLMAAGRNTPVILAGGLRPDNVASALEAIRPYAVDVSSGVEKAPGRKCPIMMKQFVQKVRSFHGYDENVRGA